MDVDQNYAVGKGGNRVIKYQKAFLLPSENLVVTNKSAVQGIGVEDSDFIEVELALQMSDIREWADEIEMLGLDEDEEF